MRNRKPARFAALIAALLLAACTTPVGPQDSNIPVSGSWNQLQASAPIAANQSAEVEHDWWKHFRAPTLDALVAEALASNKTLMVAKSRVDEARANRGIARAALFPEIDATASASRGNQGFVTKNRTIGVGQAELQASWEVDLFGRNQARTAQATAILESEEAASQAVRVELLAEVARNYFDMRNYERQLVLTRANLETQQKTFELTQIQLQGGFASDFDVQRAGAQVSTTAALIPVLQASYDAALNRLNILLGYPPGSKDAFLKTAAELTYQQTVLEALENMEDALSSYLRETARNVSLTTSVAQNRRASDLAGQQYTNGFTSLLDLLVAERDLLDAEASQAASDASLRKDLVAIYTAAGGGWRDSNPSGER